MVILFSITISYCTWLYLRSWDSLEVGICCLKNPFWTYCIELHLKLIRHIDLEGNYQLISRDSVEIQFRLIRIIMKMRSGLPRKRSSQTQNCAELQESDVPDIGHDLCRAASKLRWKEWLPKAPHQPLRKERTRRFKIVVIIVVLSGVAVTIHDLQVPGSRN
jgi:hypothetical protein